MNTLYSTRWGHNRTHKQDGKSQQRAIRRTEAEARNVAWQALTLSQKVEQLKLRPGYCAKQLLRLIAPKQDA